jgi:hypothetical protein
MSNADIDINNNNFPDGLPINFDRNKYRIGNSVNIGNRRTDFSGYTTDDTILDPPKGRKIGLLHKRNYDINDPSINKESVWDQILSTNLNIDITSNLAAYPSEWTDVGFNAQTRNATNRYGNAYQTETLTDDYDSGRFCDILKRKAMKSRYTAVTYGSIAANGEINPDATFMNKYNQLDWSDKYQVGEKEETGVL